MEKTTDKGPWYRQPWPWILMAPLVVTAIAGTVTIWLAVTTADGLVEDDYYKQGLAVNQQLERDQAAVAQGVHADLMLSADGKSIRANLTAQTPLANELGLRLTHPTRKGFDQQAVLVRQADGLYAAELPAAINGRRIVVLESDQGGWRLVGDWDSAKLDAISLGASTATQAN